MSYVNCRHWVDAGLDEAGTCSKGLHGGSPAIKDCNACPDRRRRGLGDVVNDAAKAVGIPTCGGCKKRQEWLNRLVPFAGSD